MQNFVYCRLTKCFVTLNIHIVFILVVMATDLKKSEILLKTSINMQNFKHIKLKAFLILHFYFSTVF